MNGKPPILEYIDLVVDRYTFNCASSCLQDYERLADRLTAEDLRKISDVYLNIHRNGHAELLSRWIGSQGVPGPREFGLFTLFDVLAEREIMPFASRLVRYGTPMPAGDWSLLPASLHYLREAGHKYGDLGARGYDELEATITEEEYLQMLKVAAKSRSAGQPELIWEFRLQNMGRPEERRLTNLIELLNEFVPWVPENEAELDWTKLPSRLQYLSKPAWKYGRIWVDADRERLLDGIADDERAIMELGNLAQQVRSERGVSEIEKWLQRFSPRLRRNVEAALVVFLLRVVDEILPDSISAG